MSATLADVQSSAWSLALDQTAGGGVGSGIGLIVQGLADIDQCIAIILLTVPGQDPWRPTFGTDILQYLDKPIGVVRSAIAGVVTNAIFTWEPRIKVLSVASVISISDPGMLAVTVTWTLNLATASPNLVIGNKPQTTTVLIPIAR